MHRLRVAYGVKAMLSESKLKRMREFVFETDFWHSISNRRIEIRYIYFLSLDSWDSFSDQSIRLFLFTRFAIRLEVVATVINIFVIQKLRLAMEKYRYQRAKQTHGKEMERNHTQCMFIDVNEKIEIMRRILFPKIS